MAYDYPEETLIRQFAPWFARTRGYIEKFEDTDTSGSDPVDSAGFIDNQTVLIEFKDSISPKEVRYRGSTGSSIEKKIRTVLHNLYQGENDRVTQSLKGWDQNHEPLFILVVNRMSDTVVTLLNELLSQHGPEWRFGYEVIRWDGDHGETLISCPPKPAPSGVLQEIEFPQMPSTALPRKPPMPIDTLFTTLESAGLGSHIKAMLEKLKEFGGAKSGGGASHVNFSFPKISGSAIGIWPDHSNTEKGLCVAYWPEGLERKFGSTISQQTLPGIEGPRMGHLGGIRFLKTESVVIDFWDCITSR
jgi:hypothetical protein